MKLVVEMYNQTVGRRKIEVLKMEGEDKKLKVSGEYQDKGGIKIPFVFYASFWLPVMITKEKNIKSYVMSWPQGRRDERWKEILLLHRSEKSYLSGNSSYPASSLYKTELSKRKYPELPEIKNQKSIRRAYLLTSETAIDKEWEGVYSKLNNAL